MTTRILIDTSAPNAVEVINTVVTWFDISDTSVEFHKDLNVPTANIIYDNAHMFGLIFVLFTLTENYSVSTLLQKLNLLDTILEKIKIRISFFFNFINMTMSKAILKIVSKIIFCPPYTES